MATEDNYLNLRRKIQERFPETQTISKTETLFEIDKFRRASGRPATAIGDAVRQVYQNSAGPKSPPLFTGSITAQDTMDVRERELRDRPNQRPRDDGFTGGFLNNIARDIGPALGNARDTLGDVGGFALDSARRVPSDIGNTLRTVTGQGDSGLSFNPDPILDAGRAIGEAFMAPGGGRIGLSTFPSAAKADAVTDAAGATLTAADAPLIEGNRFLEELSRPSTAAFAAAPGLAIGGRSLSLGNRLALEAGQGIVGRGAANAAAGKLEEMGAPGPVQAGGSLLAGLLAAGTFGAVSTRALTTGKRVPVGFSIDDVGRDPLEPALNELKGVLREELDFRVSGQAADQIRAGRAAQFSSRAEALAEASRQGLRGQAAERFAREAMGGTLTDARTSRISSEAMTDLIDGVHAAERAGAIPNHMAIRLTTALDKSANGLRLEPAELRLIAEYSGDREVVDALIALNPTAIASRADLNRPSVPRRGPPPVGGSGSRTPATARIPGRSAGGRTAEQSSRERAREVARQAQEEAKRIADELAAQRKNIPTPPAGLRPGQRLDLPQPGKPGRTAAGQVASSSAADRAREAARRAQEEASAAARALADRRKNIPSPPPRTGSVSGGKGGNTNVPNIARIAAQARDRARVPVFGPKRPSTLWENLNDHLNIFRSNASAGDISAPYRQGAVLSARNPVEFYANMKPMLQAFADDDFARAFNDSLATGRMGVLRERHGVFRATLDGGALSAREEAFMSRIAARLPWVNASERSYVTYLNGLRADFFDKNYVRLVESGLKGSELDKAADDLARFTNWATGRGNISGGELLNTLNGLFFAPRLLKSRFDVIRATLPTQLGGNIKDDVVRQIARENVGAWVAQNLAVMGMIRLTTNALSDGSPVSIETDPRSSDFMKLRIGNVRYDPWAGFQPIVRSAVQFAMGERKTASGNVIDANRADIALSFARTKTSPPMSIFIDQTSGETLLGEPVEGAGGRLGNLGTRLLPLSINDLKEGFEENGIVGAASTLPALVGFGVSAFSTMHDVRNEVSMDRYGVPFDELQSAELKRSILSDERVVEKERQEEGMRNDFSTFSDDIRAEQATADDLYRENMDYRTWRTSTEARKNQLIGAQVIQFGNEPIEKPKDVYEEFINKVQEHSVSATEFDWDQIDAWRAGLSAEENAFIDAQSGLRDTDFQFGRRKVLQRMDNEGYFDIRDTVWERVAASQGLEFGTVQEFRESFVEEFSTRAQMRGIDERRAIVMAQQSFEGLAAYKVYTEVSNNVEQTWIERNPELAADAVDFAALDWKAMRKAELGTVLSR